MTSSQGFATDVYGRGLSFPPRVGSDGAMVWSAGELNVRENLCTILRTSRGERVERPDFGAGLEALLFEPNSVATLQVIQDEATRAITRYEPRVRLAGVVATVNAADARAVDLTITYVLVATGTAERLQLTVTGAN
jgi:phage baseplate assembly protein W